MSHRFAANRPGAGAKYVGYGSLLGGELVVGANVQHTSTLRTLSVTAGLTPVQADQQNIANIQARMASDTRSYLTAIAMDKASAKGIAAADNMAIAADKARLHADKHNPTALAGDEAAYAAAKLKLHQDSVAAKAKEHVDKATFTAQIKSDKSQLKADQNQLRKDEKSMKK